MGVVNNPQAGEQALVNRSKYLGRLNQPLMPLGDAALRDVLSPEAELRNQERKISAQIAAADRMPLTGRPADLVDAAVARTRVGGTGMDAARAQARAGEQTKRLRMTEQKADRLGAAQGHSRTMARRDQQDAEARQAKKNAKSQAMWDLGGTLVGAATGAYAQKLATPPTEPEPVPDPKPAAGGFSEFEYGSGTLEDLFRTATLEEAGYGGMPPELR